MLRLQQEVTIEQVPTDSEPNRNKILYFPAINNCECTSTFDDLTATGEITLPRNLKFQDRNIYEGDNPLIRRGDRITIKAGYYPNLETRFEGYISKVDNNVPMVLKFEDKMYQVKQVICPNMTLTDISVRDLIDLVFDQYSYAGKDDIKIFVPIAATISSIRINECSIGVILKKLRDEFGIYSFFRDGDLYVGLAFYPNLAKEQTFLFEKSIIESELQYLKKEDVKVKVKGILIKDDNTREEISVGDADGDLRTVYQYGGTIDNLKSTIDSFLAQANYTGYYGSFTTFLQPKVQQGDYAVLDSYKYPERKGKYLIKSVKTSFGVNGGRQEIELERRIA